MGKVRRLVGLDAPGVSYDIALPVKLRSYDSTQQFLSYLRDSIKPGTEITRLLYDPGFRQAIRRIQPSSTVERLARDKLIADLDRLGPALPSDILQRPTAGSRSEQLELWGNQPSPAAQRRTVGGVEPPQVLNPRSGHGVQAVKFDTEEIKLITKVALGGGRWNPGAIPPQVLEAQERATNVMLNLISEWSIGRTEQLAGLQKGLTEQGLVSGEILYARMLECARGSLERLIATGGGSDALRRGLYNANGDIEKVLRSQGALKPQGGITQQQVQDVEAELRRIQAHSERLTEAAADAGKYSGMRGGTTAEKRKVKLKDAQRRIAEAEAGINSARDSIKRILGGAKEAEVMGHVASLISDVKAMGSSGTERHIDALRALAGENPALAAFKNMGEADRAAACAYTMLSNKFPKLVQMTNAQEIANFMRRVHPLWNAAMSVGGAFNTMGYLIGSAGGWAARDWAVTFLRRSHMPTTRRWGLVTLGVVALGTYAFSNTEYYGGVWKFKGSPVKVAPSESRGLMPWTWVEANAVGPTSPRTGWKPKGVKDMTLPAGKAWLKYHEDVLRTEYNTNAANPKDKVRERSELDSMLNFIRGNDSFARFLDRFGFQTRASLELLRKNSKLVQFIREMNLAINVPDSLPKDKKWMADLLKGLAWDARKADKISALPAGLPGKATYAQLIEAFKGMGMLADRKQLAEELARGGEALDIIPVRALEGKDKRAAEFEGKSSAVSMENEVKFAMAMPREIGGMVKEDPLAKIRQLTTEEQGAVTTLATADLRKRLDDLKAVMAKGDQKVMAARLGALKAMGVGVVGRTPMTEEQKKALEDAGVKVKFGKVKVGKAKEQTYGFVDLMAAESIPKMLEAMQKAGVKPPTAFTEVRLDQAAFVPYLRNDVYKKVLDEREGGKAK